MNRIQTILLILPSCESCPNHPQSPQLQPTCNIAESDTLKPLFVLQEHHHVSMTILDPDPQRVAPTFPTAFSQAPTSSGTAAVGFAACTAFHVFSANSAMYSR